MEKQQQTSKPKNNILKFLPKAASAVYFQNPPFSPGRDKRLSELHQHIHRLKPGRGCSGPIVSIIPDEVRRRTARNENFENQEPTSPKISCMGQIKTKKKLLNNCSDRATEDHQETKPAKTSTSTSTSTSSPRQTKKQGLMIKRLFSSVGKGSEHGRRRSDASIYDKPPLTDTSHRVPALGQMRRFASGRDTLANFDWTSQVAPVESDHRNSFSDDEDDVADELNIVPFSAPIIHNSQPRKEVNLWQRRTMNPPKPLEINVMVRTT